MTLPDRTDFVVVGAGIAGLRAAIELAPAGRVLVVTKEQLAESNTHYAQGGIAVAMGGDEDIELHLRDTLNAGDGLVTESAARVLVTEGPRRVEELLEWNTGFDREGGSASGDLMRTREGAHSRSRILHANGDATGREIGRALLAKAKATPNISLVEYVTTAELLVGDRGVEGITLPDAQGTLRTVSTHAVLLASGGAGQVYSDTTNPNVATGDGIAMAFRAGATIADMEFFQFHPTAVSLPGVPRFLLSEALRGEGAYLLNSSGERFMHNYHPQLELASRDVVARAITREGLGDKPVYLDMRHVGSRGAGKKDLVARFPGISAFLARHGLHLDRDLIPVRPAAHYLMGGVLTDLDGAASIPRLYAAGEVACTGVHGANRLASNSLLEGLVFGARAGAAMRERLSSHYRRPLSRPSTESSGASLDPRMLDGMRTVMWEQAGLLRDAHGLRSALQWLEAAECRLPGGSSRRAQEIRNLHVVSLLIVRSALTREESRGAHYRVDFPTRDDLRFHEHSMIHGPEIRFAAMPFESAEEVGAQP